MEKIIIELDNKKHEISKCEIVGDINPIETAQVLIQMAMKQLSALSITDDKKKPKIIEPTPGQTNRLNNNRG